jgi:sugar lactone lactonase YvrE
MVVNRTSQPNENAHPATGKARLLGDRRCIVGESLIWSARHGKLFFTDLVGRSFHSYDPATDVFESWDAPEFATSIGIRHDGGFVVGLEQRVCVWEPGGDFETLAVPEADRPGNRLNEGVVGPDGAFWIGTMATNLHPDGAPKEQAGALGAYYRVRPDGRVERLTPNEYGITNTMAWSADGKFLTADTVANTVYSFRVGEDGQIGDRTIFEQGFPRGLPDGSCMDAEGFLWNCRVAGGSCVARFAPDGRLDRIVELPCSWPTSCAFGGLGLDTLYVTSATFTMSEAHLAANSHEGGLFAVDAGVKGIASYQFG